MLFFTYIVALSMFETGIFSYRYSHEIHDIVCTSWTTDLFDFPKMACFHWTAGGGETGGGGPREPSAAPENVQNHEGARPSGLLEWLPDQKVNSFFYNLVYMYLYLDRIHFTEWFSLQCKRLWSSFVLFYWLSWFCFMDLIWNQASGVGCPCSLGIP